MASSPEPIYIGIDPGGSGGLASVQGKRIRAVPMPESEEDAWEWLAKLCLLPDGVYASPAFAAIEQQIPRPTNFFDKAKGAWTSSILKSTCQLYGSYMLLKGMLVAAGVPFEPVPPQRWQKELRVPPKEKGESDSSWKGRLRQKAQQLMPLQGVTLATADAILIAEWCRRWREGKLTAE